MNGFDMSDLGISDNSLFAENMQNEMGMRKGKCKYGRKKTGRHGCLKSPRGRR